MSKVKTAKTAIILIGLLFFTANASLVFAEVSNINSAGNYDSKRDSTSAARQKIINKEGKLEDRIKNFKEKIASKTATLKTRLEAFRDKNKAAAAERINTNLNTINQNQTAQMQRHLDTMTVILNKFESKAGQPNAAIAAARTNIATAGAAVTAQSEKDYTITVTTEAKIKTDAKRQRDDLHADLLALRKIVIDAKQSVGNAIREGSSSGQQ